MLRMMQTATLLWLGIAIAAYAADQAEPKLVKISESIYMAPMASNVYLLTTADGNVIIDTAPARQARQAKDLLAAHNRAPVKSSS
jgi:hypothetical protein